MASTYSGRLKIELIGSGEQANSWGTTTNNTLSNTLEESITAVYSKNLGSASSPYQLTNGQGPVAQASNESRQAALRFHGHTSAFVIEQQDTGAGKDRIFIIINDGTDNGTIQMKLTGGNLSEVVAPGGRAVLANDGTNWYTIVSSASSGGSWRTVTASDNVFAGESILANTSGGVITLTLPASPSAGDEVRFMDLMGSFDTHALTVARNGSNIYGAASDLTVATEDAAFSLVFTGASQGWKITEK